MTDYVLADAKEEIAIGTFVVDDTFFMASNGSITLDVLANDDFESLEDVVITETSAPANGTVEINPDNTITYTPETATETTPETVPEPTPEPTPEVVDTFTYTTEVIVDETVSTETGTVTVTVEDPNKSTPTTEMGELIAFPGAVGHGRFAKGGRGGDVYEVTNLNGDGAGSLQYGIVNAPAAGRTIIFRVAGWLDHGGSNYLILNRPNITIAGETAPGGGIGIRGELRILDDNIIVRHISARNDNGWSGSNQAAVRIVAYSGDSTEDIILDHISLGWASDENLTVTSTNNSGYVNRVTIQNCIIDNNLNTGYAAINYWNVTNFTYYQNLMAYSSQRNPTSTTCGPGSMEVINNMTYSYYGSAFIASWGIDFDIIGNNWDTGGNSLPWGDAVVQMNDPMVANCENMGKTDGGITSTDLYYSDNSNQYSTVSLLFCISK